MASLNAEAREVKLFAPSRERALVSGRIITPYLTGQLHKTIALDCTGSSLSIGADVASLGLNDSFIFGMWMQVRGTLFLDWLFDCRPTAATLSHVQVSVGFGTNKFQLQCRDWLDNLKVNIIHPTLVSSLNGTWARVIVTKTRNVSTRLYVNGTSVTGSGSYLTLDLGRDLSFGASVAVAGNVPMYLGHVYSYNDDTLTHAILDAIMVAQGFNFNPRLASGTYTQAMVDTLAHWWMPCELGKLMGDHNGTDTSREFTSTGLTVENDQVTSSPSI